MTSHDRGGQAFRLALDEAARAAQRKLECPFAPMARIWSSAGFDLAPASAGSEARWALAIEWEDELSTPTMPPLLALQSNPAPASADLAEAVADELGFVAGLTEEALARRWRAFVWRNHPDRQPACARERANARVALANALYDQARRAIRHA
jgi:hypothetical protein